MNDINYRRLFDSAVYLLEFVLDMAESDGFITSTTRSHCQDDLDYVVYNFDESLK